MVSSRCANIKAGPEGKADRVDAQGKGEGSLRKRAEMLSPRVSEAEQARYGKESAALIHELRLHQIELQMQNDELRRTQEELLASQDQAARLFDRAPVGYLVLDQSGMIHEVNETFCRMAGLEAAALKGKAFVEYLAEADRGSFLARYRAFFKSPAGKEMEGELVVDRRKRISVRMEAASIDSPPGSAGGSGRPRLLLALSDVTRRRQAENAERAARKALESERAILHDILDATLAGYWDWNIPAGEEYLSPGFKRMFGYEPEELPNSPETWQKLIFPEDLPKVLETFDRHVGSLGEAPFYNEVRYRHKDGSTVWVICAGRVIEWTDNGEPRRMVGCHVDITGRKEAEAALLRSTRLLESIIDAVAAPVFIKNRDGVYLGCNAAFTGMLGLKRKDIIGKTAFEIAPVELARRYHEADIALMESGRPQVYETEVVHADGTRHQVMFHKSPFRDEHGALAGIVGAMIDITDRKQMETELRDSLGEKTALLKEVHHRVKNNLQIVDSLLSLQANRSGNPHVLEVLQDSRNRVRSMALLHEALYRSGNLGRIDFSVYVDELCGRILHTYGRAADGVRLETRVAHLGLTLDQAMPCGLIINELVSNALKYGFPDGRNGRILVELSSASEEMLVLRVANDGESLPDDLDLESTPTLGLKLVFDLAGQLDGHLTIDRPSGAGASFKVVFPARGGGFGGDRP
ncbi:MAG: PAS domain S-box protein [Syntrophobacteraceae bacterium]|jgi:PAS domain S-box-containing protein|nr:PAS domain S-box protein [Syntrophobacteraceae bacterium]